MKKIAILLSFLTLLLASVAWTAITVDTGNAQPFSSNAGPITLDHACGGSSNNYLLVTIAYGGASITAMTINSVPRSYIRVEPNGSFTSIIYGLALGSSQATNTISITFDAQQSGSLGAVCLSGVDQTTPYGTTNGNHSESGSSQATVVINPSASNEVVFSTLAWDYANGSQIANFTGTFSHGSSDGNFVIGGYAFYEPGASSVTPTVNFNMSLAWTRIGISFKPSGGGPVAAPKHRITE